MKAAYFLWHPSLESKGRVVSLLLTRASRQRAPESGREFFEELLTQCGISAGLTAWSVHNFITAYFQKSERIDVAPQWEECWEALLLVDRVVKMTELRKLIGLPFPLNPDQEFDPHIRVPLRVIANFESKKQAKKCMAALKEHALTSKDWPSGVYGYELRRVSGDIQQLWIDVTFVDRIGTITSILKAQEVMSICENMDGLVHAPW